MQSSAGKSSHLTLPEPAASLHLLSCPFPSLKYTWGPEASNPLPMSRCPASPPADESHSFSWAPSSFCKVFRMERQLISRCLLAKLALCKNANGRKQLRKCSFDFWAPSFMLPVKQLLCSQLQSHLFLLNHLGPKFEAGEIPVHPSCYLMLLFFFFFKGFSIRLMEVAQNDCTPAMPEESLPSISFLWNK